MSPETSPKQVSRRVPRLSAASSLSQMSLAGGPLFLGLGGGGAIGWGGAVLT
jgi:hypothetical protein